MILVGMMFYVIGGIIMSMTMDNAYFFLTLGVVVLGMILVAIGMFTSREFGEKLKILFE